MIVWSGRGFLIVIVLLVTLFALVSVLPTELAEYGFVITCFITGVFSWFMGKKWNEEEGQIVIDKATGQEIELKRNHSLFWIKMQYWGPICAVLGLIILVQQFI